MEETTTMSFVDRLNADRSGLLDQSVCDFSATCTGSSTACGVGSQQNCKRSRTTVSSCAVDTDDRRTLPIGCYSAVDETFFRLATDPMSCVVCGDAGTGYQYSVFSCDECKVS
jgi:hypothetical protein